jgi:hypothetical protein
MVILCHLQAISCFVTGKSKCPIGHFPHACRVNLNEAAQRSVCLDGRLNAGCAPRLDMTVAEFAQWWKMHKAGQDDRLLYLKDWHFANEFPDYTAYQTPCYFQEDWLNEFYDIRQRCPQQSHSAGNANDTPQTGEAAEKGDAEEGVADGDRSGGSNAGCDVASSDYRFVYLGCKVQFPAFHLLVSLFSDNVCIVNDDTHYFVLTTHTVLTSCLEAVFI